MKNKLNVFLPMRTGSERVPNKNTRNFAGVKGGLCKIKLDQLIKSDLIENIFVSTDDPIVVDISNELGSKKVEVIVRPRELATSFTSTDELIKYVPEIMPDGHVMWTHVTSPFINEDYYNEIIDTYFKNLGDFDSLMTVTKIQKFIWNESKPLTYDRKLEKWPRTQTISPLWEINSGAFITSKLIYESQSDRIGERPYFFELTENVAFDIDWEADFKIAEGFYQELCR